MGCRKISSSPAASVESDPNLLTVHCDAFKGISLNHHLFVTNQSNEHTLLLFLIQCIILSFMACDTKLLVLYNTLVEMWQAQEETRAWISGTFCGCTIDDVILYFLHYQHSNHRRICRERT